ncbi:c-type cytochrome [Acidovorax sp. BL-A-41-H1]|uniref:c-type cytochrome n=1 Tax=Acidovorax sp. BL-A-41-H1 TaxID=3421102 RepID=UPI003F7ADA98
MPPDDEAPPKRPKWVAWALIAVMALAVLGMLNLGWRMLPAAVRGADAGAPGATDAVPAPTAALPGRTAVEGGDCLRCHGMDRNYVGPSFRQIAARYSGRADAADYLVRKIREGGVGEWGRVVMPRQPHVSEAQAREMAQWLLSLAPVDAAPSAASTGATR